MPWRLINGRGRGPVRVYDQGLSSEYTVSVCRMGVRSYAQPLLQRRVHWDSNDPSADVIIHLSTLMFTLTDDELVKVFCVKIIGENIVPLVNVEYYWANPFL